MVLRLSKLFLRTLREDPADAEVAEPPAAGPRRLHPPRRPGHLHLAAARPAGAAQRRADHPRGDGRHRRPGAALPGAAAPEPYEATGRWTEYGDGIFRLKDRKGADYLLGPDPRGDVHPRWSRTCTRSYKDLPLSIYQIQNKYRDEARPRAGLLRGREFVMKDSYSFDVDDAGPGRELRSAPRRLHPDLRPARLRLRHRQGDVRRHGRLARARSSSPRPRSARTPTSAARRAATPPTSRPSPPCAPRGRRLRRRARRARPRTPRTPPPSTRSSTHAQRAAFPARGRRGPGPPPTR